MMSGTQLQDFTRLSFESGPYTREVFRRGQGPAVIIIHEVPGIHPLVLRFAERVAHAGHTVFLPSLLGEPGRAPTTGYAAWQMLQMICIRREFSTWAAHRSSSIVDWLRALARKAHAECGGPGVGAIGMCFSGGFALAMMTEPAVIAPVLSQPSFGERFEAIEIDPAEAQPYPGMKPHAVLTINLRDDDPSGATKRAETRVIEFFRQRLVGGK
jgi:hypothetical protein